MCRDIERGEVNGVQIPGNKIEPQCPFLDTLAHEHLQLGQRVEDIFGYLFAKQQPVMAR